MIAHRHDSGQPVSRVKLYYRRMDRKQKLLEGIDVATLVGAEIGALCRPFVRRQDGRVIYVDHATTEQLRHKYQSDPGVSVDDIVDVDVVWGPVPLAESIGVPLDYVVASHVIEHVPDLITWLEELRAALKPSGELRLIVPDKRFTFDRLRQMARFADALYARMIRAKVPCPHLVLDYVANVAKVNGGHVWSETIDDTALERHHSIDHAVACAKQAAEGIYHDVHCWVFTPQSFARLFAEFSETGVAVFECTHFHDTARNTIEFFVGMRPSDDRKASARSWAIMADHCTTIPKDADANRPTASRE